MSENNEQVEANVWRVFDIYRSAGVMDEGLILENIAFYALYWRFRKEIETNKYGTVEVRNGYISFGSVANALARVLSYKFDLKSEQTFLPTPPKDMREEQQMEVLRLLVDAFENISDLGEWFDQYLIPQTFSISKGGRYATPRHLVNFMTGLANINPSDLIADFACGTGGMLVASGRVKSVTGIEISPNMARLAFTNLVLHEQMEHDLYLGNTFDVASREERFRKSAFDVVVMNPPFGAKVDVYLLEESARANLFPYGFKANSETLFAMLAYEKLKPGGRLAILIPNSPLFSNNNGETHFRERMVKEGAIRAIVSLPRDTMKPFSGGLLTNVFYAVKPTREEKLTNGIWFYRPRYDGFSEGRNRRPIELNDLPLIEEACRNLRYGEGVQVTPLVQSAKVIGYSISAEHQTLSYKVRELGNDYVVEVFEQTKSVEVIYATATQVYRGKPDVHPIQFELPSKENIDGEFSLSELFGDFLGDGPAYAIRLKKGKGEIRKGGLRKTRFGTKTKDEVQATGLLLDSTSKILSDPFPLVIDVSDKTNPPIGFTVSREDEEKPFAKLLIFYDGINGTLLRQEHGRESLYLCYPDSERGIGLLFNPKKKIFSWSLKIRVGEKGDVTLNKGEVFQSDQIRTGVVFDLQSTVLGVYVNRQEILNTRGAGLLPERYWIEKHEPRIIRSAARILGDIKLNQTLLNSTLDRLLSISEVQAIAGTELPPPLHLIEPPAGILQGIQQSIWEIIQSQTEQMQDYVTPRPFQADDIHEKIDENISIMDVQRTLELFERMGLIVAVSYEGVPYFRLPEGRDLIKGEEK